MAQFALGFQEYTGDGQAPTRERFDFESGEITATRIFKGPWENRIDFIHDHLDVRYPDIPQAVLANIDILGLGVSSVNDTTGQAEWERVQLTVNYKTLQQETPSNPRGEQNLDDFSKRRFIEEAIEGGVEMQQTEGASWQIADGEPNAGDKLNELDKINKLLPLETLTIKQNFLGIPNWMEMHLARGKVNNNAWISPSGIPFASESLRYDGTTADTKIDIDTRGSEDSPFPVWELTHKFSHNVFNWNKRWHKGQYQRFIDNTFPSFQTNLFPQADMYSIFFGAGGRTFSTNILAQINTLIQDVLILVLANPNSIHSSVVRGKLRQIAVLIRSFGFNV